MMSQKTETLPDSEIVKLALKNSADFVHVINRYEQKLARYIRRLGVSTHEDRQDVLQEIFIKVYKNLNDFDSNLSFSSWIYRIAHNEAITWYRKRSVRPEGYLVADTDQVMLFVADESLSAEDRFDLDIDARALYSGLTKLDIKYRDPLLLKFFEHKEYEEISDILKIPIGTVGTLISRGKKKLEEIISQQQINK